MLNLFDVIDAEKIGKAFAHESDHEQAGIINAMAREMIVSCKDDHTMEMQCCYVSDRIDKNGKILIEHLAEFIKLRENTEAK